jgi:acetyl esterase/lipase
MMADAEYAVLWASENAGSLGADTSLGFLVGGAEAGAHLAAAAAIRCRNKHLDIKLTGQLLIVPTLMAWPDKAIPTKWADRLKSHTDMADASVLSGDLFSMLFSAVGFPESEWHKGENFPMWADDLRGLPPAYIAMDEVDPTRDQAFLFAELLQEAGVLTRTDYYRGLPNMFVQFPELPMTAIAGGQLAAGVAWLLQARK